MHPLILVYLQKDNMTTLIGIAAAPTCTLGPQAGSSFFADSAALSWYVCLCLSHSLSLSLYLSIYLCLSLSNFQKQILSQDIYHIIIIRHDLLSITLYHSQSCSLLYLYLPLSIMFHHYSSFYLSIYLSIYLSTYLPIHLQ